MLSQVSADGNCFLGGLEGLVQLAVLGLTVGEVVEGASEVGGVGGWVVFSQGPVEAGGFLGSLEGLYMSPRSGQAYTE